MINEMSGAKRKSYELLSSIVIAFAKNSGNRSRKGVWNM